MLNSIGSDMEVFAKRKDTGEHVAICGLIGGTKEDPLQLEGMAEGFMIQEDNVALEFNIPPAMYREYFVEYMRIARNRITDILDKFNFEMSVEASVSFDTKELTHPNALVFGCEPDYNAWSKTENIKPRCNDPTLRTAGGHIHVGTSCDMLEGVKNMDLYLGVPSVLIDDKPSSIARRALYGKAGAMRPKPYGFEYRVLSNFWMFDDTLVDWVYRQTYLACSKTTKSLTDKEGKYISECINTGNKTVAEKICKDFGIKLPKKGDYKEPKELKINKLSHAKYYNSLYTDTNTHSPVVYNFDDLLTLPISPSES
jgi:hypothetical protein